VFTADEPIEFHGNAIYGIANNGITNNSKTFRQGKAFIPRQKSASPSARLLARPQGFGGAWPPNSFIRLVRHSLIFHA
jgi:hypothetical protein